MAPRGVEVTYHNTQQQKHCQHAGQTFPRFQRLDCGCGALTAGRLSTFLDGFRLLFLSSGFARHRDCAANLQAQLQTQLNTGIGLKSHCNMHMSAAGMHLLLMRIHVGSTDL